MKRVSLCLLAAVGCGDATMDLGSVYIASAIVDPTLGGAFLVDEAPYAGLGITLGPGAVSEAVLVGVREASALDPAPGRELVGPAFSFEPVGLQPSRATISLPFSETVAEGFRAGLLVETSTTIYRSVGRVDAGRVSARVRALGRVQAALYRAPPSTPCRTDRDCGAGRVCDLRVRRCVDGRVCAVTEDCDVGQVCAQTRVGGRCQLSTSEGGRCRVTQHCPPGTACDPRAQRCRTTPLGVMRCRGDAMCPRGQRCDLRTNTCR